MFWNSWMVDTSSWHKWSFGGHEMMASITTSYGVNSIVTCDTRYYRCNNWTPTENRHSPQRQHSPHCTGDENVGIVVTFDFQWANIDTSVFDFMVCFRTFHILWSKPWYGIQADNIETKLSLYSVSVWQSYLYFLFVITRLRFRAEFLHYNDVIMSAVASQITSVSIVCSTLVSRVD